MVLYTCNACLKEFNKKSNYLQHVENKKKPCIQTINNYPKLPDITHDLCKITQDLCKITQNYPNLETFEKNINFNKNFTNEKIIDNSDNLSENFNNNNLINNNNILEHKCNYCYKTFKTIYNLQRHLKGRCKVKKIDDEKKENIFNNLLEKEQKFNLLMNNFEILQQSNKNLQEHFINSQENIKKLQENFINSQENNKKLQENNKNLQKQIKELENKLKENNKNYDEKIKNIITKNINSNNTNNTNNTNNIVNNTNIVNNNIVIPSSKLVNFGKEDLSKIEYSEIMKKIYSPFTNGTTLFNELLLLIHFNPNHPEFQNIYMSDNNREHYMSYEDNEWKLSESAYNTIIQQIHDLKELNEDNFIEVFEDKNHKYYKPTEKLYSNLNKYFEEDDNGKRNTEFMKIVDKKLKATLYNNKDKTKENYKKLKDDIVKDKSDKLIK